MAFARTHLGGGEEADEVAAFVLGKAAKKTHLMGPNQMPKLVSSEVGADKEVQLGLLAPNPRPASSPPARGDYAVTSQRVCDPLHSRGFVCAVRTSANRANETPYPRGAGEIISILLVAA